MAELDDEVNEGIQKLCAEGDALAKKRNYPAALKKYWAAWDMLPEPQTEWVAATWILAAIGDANFLGGDYVAGRDNLSMAMHCPDAIGNPFLHLRLGQCQFELGNLDRAADELAGVQDAAEIDAGEGRIGCEPGHEIILSALVLHYSRRGQAVLANPLVQLLPVAAGGHRGHVDVLGGHKRQLRFQVRFSLECRRRAP